MPGVLLGVDFGSSSTAAVVRLPDGRVSPLLFDGSPLLPSAVYADAQVGLLTGRDAQHGARVAPERFEPNPKRRVDEGSVLLADQTYPVVTLIAAVLRRVAGEAVRAAGRPVEELVLTHPVAWGGPRREVLARAAALAGLPVPRLVPEPVAAAGYFVSVLGHGLPVGAGVLIYDLGAGTFDATALRRTARGFEVLASEGVADAGGLDIDAAILAHLRRSYPEHDFDVLLRPEHGRSRLALWDNIRSGKESLSRLAGTVIPVPVLGIDAPLGRETLDGIAAPVLRRTMEAAGAAMRAFSTGNVPVFLVGGASRMPAVALSLHRAFGAPPIAIEQPELVVAEGSLYAIPAPPSTVEATNPFTATAPPAPAAPVSTPPWSAAPVSTPPWSAAPVSTSPWSTAPVSTPPGSVAPVSTPPGVPVQAGPTAFAPPPGTSSQPPPAPGRLPGAPGRPPFTPGQAPPGSGDSPLRRAARPVGIGLGLLAVIVLAPLLAQQDGRKAIVHGADAPLSPTGLVACLALVLIAGLGRAPGLRLGRPDLPRPGVVLAVAGWASAGLAGTLTFFAALLRASETWQDVRDLAADALAGMGRVLLIAGMAAAAGLVVAALWLLSGRGAGDLWNAAAGRSAGAGVAAGVLLAAVAATHIFDPSEPFHGLARDPVLYLADEVLGADGVVSALQRWGIFAVTVFVLLVVLLFATVAVRVAVERLPTGSGTFATGLGYGVCAALGAYLVVHVWFELQYWARPWGPLFPVLRVGQLAWAASRLFLLGVLVLLAVVGALSAVRRVRQLRI